MNEQADIGLIGLAVMGQNLALNIADHGYRVAVFNRTSERTQAFVDSPEAAGRPLVPTVRSGRIPASDQKTADRS